MEADQTTVNIVDDGLPELLTTLLDIYTRSVCNIKMDQESGQFSSVYARNSVIPTT